jgi:hypothetical protein
MENLFNHILDDDEKIIKIIRPHKGKYFFSGLFVLGLVYLIFVGIAMMAMMLPDEETGSVVDPIYLLIPVGIFVASMLITWLFMAVYYKNNYFAYTNKRLIIRSGIVGVDYKSLDMSMIGMVNVYVSLLDKIVHKNTGSLTFGSIASGTNGIANTRFPDIPEPYETCKEIKSAIDKYKNSQVSKK